ncbi:MAG: hypothetical protein Q8M37_10010 [Nevskia sp.]|nr:hypothetical protein [Nevskia sp.]
MIAVAAICVLVMLGGFYFLVSTACINEPLQEISSPAGLLRIVVFQRDCGATTGFSTQASLLSAGQSLSDRGGNLFVADTNHGAAPSGSHGGPIVEVVWLDAAHLRLTHHPRARVFLAVPEVGGVRAEFVGAVDQQNRR